MIQNTIPGGMWTPEQFDRFALALSEGRPLKVVWSEAATTIGERLRRVLWIDEMNRQMEAADLPARLMTVADWPGESEPVLALCPRPDLLRGGP